ncbi:MAG: glycosyltransferase [Proteobacteria bacterium]|nr:glycosyltransferase [Pseudomonadota bacterium]
MHGLLFTTLFPNQAQPFHGIFVKRRYESIIKKGNIRYNFICPISFTSQFSKLARIPLSTNLGSSSINYPRFCTFPKILKTFDGPLLYFFTKSLVKQKAKKYIPDFIDANYAYPDGYAAMQHAKTIKKPMILTVRGSDLYLLAKDKCRRNKISQTLRFASGVIALSEGLKKLAIELGACPEHIKVIGNGVDQNLFIPVTKNISKVNRGRLGIPEKARVILGVGRLVPLKRFDLMLYVISKIKKSSSHPVYGIIVGAGPEMGKLQQIAASLDILNQVKFVGQKSPEELPKWYNLSDALMVLSTHEGSPNVPMEALSCGTPVIATQVGNLPEIINKDNGILLKNINIDTIASATTDYWHNNPSPQDRISNSVALYSWDAVAEKQESFIRRILQGNQ